MKTIKLFMLPLLLLVMLYSCKKLDQNIPDDNTGNDLDILKNMTVPAGFKWSTFYDYDFYISGGSGQTIKITSDDETVTYHKGTYIENGGSYKVSLRIPSFVESVKINTSSVDLNGGGAVYFDLSTKANLVNYCVTFDGVNDYVDFGDITELNNVSAFTIEGYVNQASNTDAEVIFSKHSDANNDISIYTGTGTLYIDLGNGSDSYATWANYSATLASNNWFHFAVVYDGSGGTNADRLKLYINGNTTPITLSFTGTIPATTSSSLSGEDAYLSDATSPFGGYMDEFRVWSDARTPAEISANYNKLIDVASPDLVAYYRMDEGSGTSIEDLTSNAYDGTLNGLTWAMFANGFDSDGDTVTDINDDFWDDPERAHINYYPPADTGTLVFEDLWPGTGDYDFNDLVLGYQFKTVTSGSNLVTEIYCYFEIRAHGAELDNGFGFQLPDADPNIVNDVLVSGYSHTQGIINLIDATKFEAGHTGEPVIIAIDQIANKMDKFTNTDDWKPTMPYVPMTLTLEVKTRNYEADDFSMATWNPFMFVDQIRGYEVHKLDYPPTDLVDPSYFGTYEDASDPGNNEYYRTESGLPWALEFQTEFEYPFEKKYIHIAYLKFIEWAESAGTLSTDWYSNTGAGYRNNTYIYH